MSGIVELEDAELRPVLELETNWFSTQERAWPSASRYEVPDAWHRYWLDSLADSGIAGVEPLYPGSDHVSTSTFANHPMFEKVIRSIIQQWGGIESLSDPDANPVFNGGMSLFDVAGKLLVEPTCCSDLGNLSDWGKAVHYRGEEWKVIWIGHPWISVRFQDPMLILSKPHETKPPVGSWAISPCALSRAVDRAKVELERFAVQIADLLPLLSYQGNPRPVSRMLVGLNE